MSLTLSTWNPRRGVRTLSIRTGRGSVAALEACPAPGTEPRGCAVLVGTFVNKELQRPILTLLAHEGYRTVAYDQFGQSRADGGGDDPAAYGVAPLAEDLCAIVSQVGQGSPVHLVGWCAGGFIARAATALRADLIASLILVNAGPTIAAAHRGEMLITGTDMMERRGMQAYWTALEASQQTRLAAMAPRSKEMLRNYVFGTRPAHLIGLSRSLVSEPFAAQRLRECAIPILVAYGSQDEVWPAGVHEAMAAELGARVAIIEGAGHSVLLNHTRRVVEIAAEFWSEVDGR